MAETLRDVLQARRADHQRRAHECSTAIGDHQAEIARLETLQGKLLGAVEEDDMLLDMIEDAPTAPEPLEGDVIELVPASVHVMPENGSVDG